MEYKLFLHMLRINIYYYVKYLFIGTGISAAIVCSAQLVFCAGQLAQLSDNPIGPLLQVIEGRVKTLQSGVNSIHQLLRVPDQHRHVLPPIVARSPQLLQLPLVLTFIHYSFNLIRNDSKLT